MKMAGVRIIVKKSSTLSYKNCYFSSAKIPAAKQQEGHEKSFKQIECHFSYDHAMNFSSYLSRKRAKRKYPKNTHARRLFGTSSRSQPLSDLQEVQDRHHDVSSSLLGNPNEDPSKTYSLNLPCQRLKTRQRRNHEFDTAISGGSATLRLDT